MELTNEFGVGVPVEKAWDVLTDVELIAPCLPGAELQEVEGDEYRGIVKVKVGPITAQYKGAARFVEKDTAGHKAVLRAEGRDTRGPGKCQRDHHGHADRRRHQRDQGHRHHRPHGQRQGRAVRSGCAGRGQRQAPRPVRRATRDQGPLAAGAGVPRPGPPSRPRSSDRRRWPLSRPSTVRPARSIRHRPRPSISSTRPAARSSSGSPRPSPDCSYSAGSPFGGDASAAVGRQRR